MILTDTPDPDDDVIPAVPEAPRTQSGDIGEMGNHRIGCGDARDPDFPRRVIGEGEVDAAFLDPPYNVVINGHANSIGRHREFAMASGEMTNSEFQTFLADTFGACAEVSRNGAVHFVCMDWRHMDDVSVVGQRVYGAFLILCFWNKSNAGMRSLYRSKHELVFVFRVGPAPHTNNVELGRHGRNRRMSGTMRRSIPIKGIVAQTLICIRRSSRLAWLLTRSAMSRRGMTLSSTCS